MTDGLTLWTVYDHPTDYPDAFVARKWIAGREVKATTEVIASISLDALRYILQSKGLVCLTRDPGDDPCIMETWL